jgi:hypothetical protein
MNINIATAANIPIMKVIDDLFFGWGLSIIFTFTHNSTGMDMSRIIFIFTEIKSAALNIKIRG